MSPLPRKEPCKERAEASTKVTLVAVVHMASLASMCRIAVNTMVMAAAFAMDKVAKAKTALAVNRIVATVVKLPTAPAAARSMVAPLLAKACKY